MPTTAAASRSWEAARMALPILVFWMNQYTITNSTAATATTTMRW